MLQKVKSLEVGQVFKNYKSLCEFLNEKYKGGKSKELQVKNWERYFRFSTIVNKIVIEEIYAEPKLKIDNRGKSDGSRNNNMTYGTHIDSALINYFKKKDSPLYLTTNQLAQIVGMINCNYSTASSNKSKYFKYAFKELGEKVNQTAAWDVFAFIKSSIKYLIRSSLERLTERQLLEFEESYILVHNHKSRVATVAENDIIKGIEDEVLKAMGILKRNQLQYNDRLRNEYYENVENLVKIEIPDVDKLFTGYKIYLMLEVINEFEEQKEEKDLLNAKFIEGTMRKIEKQKEKYQEEYSYIGKPSPFWSEHILDKLNENYRLHAEYIIKSLCSIDYKDIRDIINSQIVTYSKKAKYAEMANEIIENEQDEEMKDVWKAILK